MSKHLLKACNTCDFGEICKIIESKTSKPSQQYKDVALTPEIYVQLRQFTHTHVIKHLGTGTRFPDSLVALCFMLGDDHVASMKSIICNTVISQKSADISEFLQLSFQGPESLKGIFFFVEETVESVSIVYNNLPPEWGLELQLVIGALVMIKQAICDYFFKKDAAGPTYSAGLIHTINFEKKLETFFTNKLCCTGTGEEAGEGPRPPECIHKRMLSNVFAPHLDVFYEYWLIAKPGSEFQQGCVEKGIIRAYIDTFKHLEFAYSIATYFNTRQAYGQLVEVADKALLALVRKTRVETTVPKIIVVLSTILYMQQVLEEFINSVALRQQTEFKLASMEASRKLERQQAIKLEREFNNNFTGNIADFEAAYNSLFEGQTSISTEVKCYVLELCMSQLFSKICMLKMNPQISAQIECGVKMLEQSLRCQFKTVPYITLLTDYIRIFTFPVEPREEFIKNFKALSANRFEFTQILRAFEDQGLAMRMYEAFKRMGQ